VSVILPAVQGERDAFRMSVGEEEYFVLALPRPRLALPPGLTVAEESVAMLIVLGLSNAEIAKARGSSVRTVANQVAAILTKASVSSRRELIAKCRGLAP